MQSAINGTLVHSVINDHVLQNETCYNRQENMSDAEILRCLNDGKARQYLPAILYLAFLMVIGSAGNIMVGYVYYFRLKKGSSHFFILCLVFLDLTNCLIGMPAEIADLCYPYMFDSPVVCKCLRFLESVVGIASAVILIQVAFARYFKICRPLQKFPLNRTRVLTGSAFTCAFCLSWPALLIFGKKTIVLPGDLRGYDCSTDDHMRGSVYIVLYYICLVCAFVVSVTILTVLYVLIGTKLWKKRKMTVVETRPDLAYSGPNSPEAVQDSPRSSTSSSYEALPVPASPNSILNLFSKKQSLSRKISSNSVTAIISKSKDDECRRASSDTVISVRAVRPTIKTGKMTLILFSVTIAFILSFLPYLTIMICRSRDSYCERLETITGEVIYKIASKSFFLNNAANPMIYSFLSERFRKECANTFREMRKVCYSIQKCRK